MRDAFPSDAALGVRADYRMELKIAADRAVRLHPMMPTLYTHSLLDSLAYSIARVETMATGGAVSEATMERWAVTMATISMMLRDTFKADEVIVLRADFNPDTHFEQEQVQRMLLGIVDEFGIDYTLIDVDERADVAVKDIAVQIEAHLG